MSGLFLHFSQCHLSQLPYLNGASISLPRNGYRVGLCNVLFYACSALTHVTAHTLAGSPKATPYIGGLQLFCYFHNRHDCFRPERFSRVGLSPTGKAPPYHGARREPTLANSYNYGQFIYYLHLII